MASSSTSPAGSGSSSSNGGPELSTRQQLRDLKARQRQARVSEKQRAQQSKAENKAAQRKKRGKGMIAQLKQVFTMTRAHNPRVVLWMILAFVAALAVGLVIGLLLNNWITWLLIAIPFGVLAALIIMNRMAERAAFAQIDGRPGAAGAALSTIRRGWIVPEQPVAVNPRTQDAVFRAVGRPGVVLVTEGPSQRVRALVEKERKAMQRFLPNVPIQIVESGHGEGQVALYEVAPTLKRMKKTLTRQEVQAVDKRLSALGTSKLPIPAGVDPYRARPDRKGARGR